MSREDKALTQSKKAIWDNISGQALCIDLDNQKDWEGLAKRFCEVM